MPQTPPKKKVLLTHLDWNLQRLDESIKQGHTDYYKSAALQRFGYTYTMAIKNIHGFAEFEEEPEEEKCIARATQSRWIGDSHQWEEMTTDFKRINQKPAVKEAEEIFQKLPLYQQALNELYLTLQKLV